MRRHEQPSNIFFLLEENPGCHGEGLGTAKLVPGGGLARPRPGFICGGPWMMATLYYFPKFHGFGGAARGRQHDPEVNQ